VEKIHHAGLKVFVRGIVQGVGFRPFILDWLPATT
jgi:hydrogenase maturation factor HypF (carbamoyltransferase family)